MKKGVLLTSATKQLLEKMGSRIKRARLRRNIRVELLAEKTGISEATLYAIEKGASTVSLGAYVAVLAELGLDKDIECIALDEKEKVLFCEKNLFGRKRATRNKE